MTPSSGFCFHANISDLVAEFAEVVDCHLVSEFRANKSVKIVVEWDDAIVAGALDVHVFAEVAGMVFIAAPFAVLFAFAVGVVFFYFAD